ncbi:DUF1800 family protein [Leucothrix arctica]|uniref:DUF1800 domain-containing protein n=1 Tax=Leucothrix arctica TaxID=1481894 RepID=A0A317CFC5_9GAMM|nr:DUF1800 family protein [Leucothrix arctica]PWQ97278.1 hypothetical protein DKT75_06995 [Leucothrix arctica]
MRPSMNCVTVNTPRSLVSQWLMLLFLALLSFLPFSLHADENNISITLIDGTANNAPMPETRIDIREVLEDGTTAWRKRLTTDSLGQASTFLEGIATNRKYQLSARSSFNNRSKTLTISTEGDHTFQVGTPLLNVTVRNSHSGEVFANTRVYAYQVQSDGSYNYLSRADSDENGQLTLDLPVLSDGGKVQLKINKPLSDIDAYSELITTAGDINFDIGKLQVSVLNSDNEEALANQDIYIYTQEGETSKWYGRAKTDDSGQLHLNLKGLYDGTSSPQAYMFKTRSPFNNKYKQSQNINTLGEHKFLVGTPLLHVTLSNQNTQAFLANTRITAYQILDDNSTKYLDRATTDTNGQLSLDLPTLSDGGSVQLVATKPLSNIDAYSSIISNSGKIDFKVGVLQVKVLNNDTQQAIADQDVYIYSQSAEGENKWYGKSKTDADGRLQLNLKGLNSNADTADTAQSYVLRTRSPFNNQYKYSQLIEKNGEYIFSVGEPLLHATLKDASNDNAIIADAEVRAYQLVDGKLKGLGKATTDEQGMVSFDIPALAEEDTVVQLWTKVFNSKMWAKSQYISSSGSVDFPLGTTTVTVIDGSVIDGEALADLRVNIREITGDDTTKYVSYTTTDSEGLLRLTLPELSQGKSYKLDASNPSALVRQRKYSQAITTTGEHTFVLGTQLLQITLKNALNQLPVTDKKVTVYQNTDDGAQWRGSITTDSNGQASLDLPQLADAGNSFYLRARKPYDANDTFSEDFATGTFTFDFPVGKTPVTLTDKNTGSPIANIKIHSYEILSTGSRKWQGWGLTDANGTAHFDLPSLAEGNRHTFRAINPFANNKHHYSEIVTAEGPVNFAVGIGEDGSLDLVAPELVVTSPADSSDVGNLGFMLIGTASDNKQLGSISVSYGGNNYPTSIDTTTSIWQLSVPAEHLTADSELAVTITATDAMNNQTVVEARYNVIADASAPTIVISSPSDNGFVPKTGFLATGTVTDDTGIKMLFATLEDSNLGTVMEREIDVSSSGNWALAVNNGQLTESGTAKLTLVATDIAERQSTIEVTVNITAAEYELRHMINRITFGANDALINDVRSIGASAFLEQQLAPDEIDDEALAIKLTEVGTPSSISELQRYQLNHMIYSKRQLREVMAWFWENHFNTFIKKSGNTVAYELAEHDSFRANALGNFRTLLNISAKSPAMLIYLDNILNVSDDANENYAREVMELSTCGVDACYTQTDVEELAEILTGWQVKDDTFFFNDDQHTKGSKLFQGVTIAEAGVEEGNQALDMLATHEATANYICGKLINVFISDEAIPSLNERCTNTFQAAAYDDDQMSQVVRGLLTSPEFNDSENFNNKIKTPVEFAVAVTRALDAQGTHADIPSYTDRMGLSLFFNPVPTGWSELGSTWINSGTLLERTRFANQIAAADIGSQTYIDPVTFFKDKNIETPEGITAYLFDLLGGDIWSDLERAIALEILNDEDTFDMEAENADAKLRELIGTIQSYPEYHYQ